MRDREEKTAAEAIAMRLSALEITVPRRTGENDQLYGSVTNADIAELLAARGFEIDRRKILLPDPIKQLGEVTVPVKLHREVVAQLRVVVVKEE
jgi:large subunit ribosomal protein L9